ncbi:MAG: glycosyltransferase family 1 protein [Anaerolineae bacterium]|jgi:glycosyltransferase involved in cell wall biosynthesis
MQAPAQDGLRIAINAHLLSGQDSYRSAGVHQYILHLLQYLSSVDGEEMRFTALLGAEGLEPASDLRFLRSRWHTSRPSVRVLWEQLVQPRVLNQIEAHLVHAPVFVGPLVAPCPVVTTIHDLSFIRFPHLFRRINRLYLTLMTRLSARRARRLIAVSEHAARETVHLLGVPREKIDVVYHGVDPAFRPLPANQVATFRERQGLPHQFVLFVGTLEPRKNLRLLIEAFSRVYDGRIQLVLVGGKGWLYDDLFARVEELNLSAAVLFPGYVRSEELPLWYNAATALAYPSLYEGFGMPVTEAQACGTPVLTSNQASLPEAAGEAALLVDPQNVEEIAAGLNQLLNNSTLRMDLKERGLVHARGFSWPRTVQQTIQVYRRALARGTEGEPQ